ncbi:MAG: DUF362 domain-containing protein [bacterium]|nr:DUF362 domain-containing protein [bacterium]
MMHRRRFLTLCSRVVAGLALLPGLRGLRGTAHAADSLPDLVLAKGDAREIVRKAVEALGGIGRFVEPGAVVALKPNASFDKPADWGATTHPDVLSAVIELCFEAEAKRVYVIDHTMARPDRCFRRNGTSDAVAAFPKAKLVSLDNEKGYVTVDLPDGKALKRTMIPKVLQRADVFINLPTAKSHSATGVSLGLKNLMGLVWDRNHFHNSIDLDQGVADLATILKPQLTILDALKVLQTGGPTGPGKVLEFGGVVAGVDPVAVDAYGAGLSTWNGQTMKPAQIAHIKKAADHGLGSLQLSELHIEELT